MPKSLVLSVLILAVCLSARAELPDFPAITWTKSLHQLPSNQAPTVETANAISTTEVRGLVAYKRRLYAAGSLWTDAYQTNPNLPGPQILVLDRPREEGGRWRVEHQLDERVPPDSPDYPRRRFVSISVLEAIRFQTDGRRRQLNPDQEFLVAGMWDRRNAVEVLSRDPDGAWRRTELIAPGEVQQGVRMPAIHIRSIQQYRVNGVDTVFVGTSGQAKTERVNGVDVTVRRPPRIYKGVYDASVPGKIAWDKTPEIWNSPPGVDDRVTSFAEADGTLFATVCNKIYRRQNASSSWSLIFNDQTGGCQPGPGEAGYRGLTRIVTPTEHGPVDTLLTAMENLGRVLRLYFPGTDLNPGRSLVTDVEMNVNARMETRLGLPTAPNHYTISAYNGMAPVRYGPRENPITVMLFGVETARSETGQSAPDNAVAWHGWERGGWFVIRYHKDRYEIRRIQDRERPNELLVAPRTLIASPFEGEERVIYAGGFDCNHIERENHNTGWIYRGAY